MGPDGALATARLVTGRSTDGVIKPIFSFVLFGLPGQITSHSNHVALVDTSNGQLLPAPPRDAPGVSMYKYRRLVSNGVCSLPDWDSALQHVKAAHLACPNFVFVGWDVAFTPLGAVILEGNANWEAATYQTLRGEPLSCTKFATMLASHLREQ
jgi:hypothetical protein